LISRFGTYAPFTLLDAKHVLHERYISQYQRVTPLRVAEKKIIS